MAALAPAAAQVTNQDWHTRLQQLFPQLQATSVYDAGVNYQDLFELFNTRKYEFKTQILKDTSQVVKDMASAVEDESNGIGERVLFAALGVPLSVALSPVMGLLFGGLNAATYINHRTAGPNEFCTCSHCTWIEQRKVTVEIPARAGAAYARTIAIMQACHGVRPLRTDHWAPPPPPPTPAPVYVSDPSDYDGGYSGTDS